MKIIQDTTNFLNKFNMIEPTNGKPYLNPNLNVRVDHLQEELDELKESVKNGDLLEVIDALIDIVYIAAGTSVLCNIDFEKHWDEVQRANMAKERGISKRGHSFDVKKPEGWQPPDHQKVLKSYE